MRIRVTKALKIKRSLSRGTAYFDLPPGDYEVGQDLPKDVAETAIATGRAKRLPEKGERETKAEPVPKKQRRKRKPAKLEKPERSADSDGAEPDSGGD